MDLISFESGELPLKGLAKIELNVQDKSLYFVWRNPFGAAQPEVRLTLNIHPQCC